MRQYRSPREPVYSRQPRRLAAAVVVALRLAHGDTHVVDRALEGLAVAPAVSLALGVAVAGLLLAAADTLGNLEWSVSIHILVLYLVKCRDLHRHRGSCR